MVCVVCVVLCFVVGCVLLYACYFVVLSWVGLCCAGVVVCWVVLFCCVFGVCDCGGVLLLVMCRVGLACGFACFCPCDILQSLRLHAADPV